MCPAYFQAGSLTVGISQLISTRNIWIVRLVDRPRRVLAAVGFSFFEGLRARGFGQDNHKSSDRLPECAYANLCQLTNGTAFAQYRKAGAPKGGRTTTAFTASFLGALGRVYINVICVVVLCSQFSALSS